MSQSLYETIKEANIPFASHESDLYFPVTEQSREILSRPEFKIQKQNAEIFTNQVEGGRWYDIPFAYLPFWEEAVARGKRIQAAKDAKNNG